MIKSVGRFFFAAMALGPLPLVYAQVGVIESIDEFKQEIGHGMAAVLWYSKDPAHEKDKEWCKAYENVQKAYKKLDSQTDYVRFFTVDLANRSLAPLQQEQGLATLPNLAVLILYKEGVKKAVLPSVTAKSWHLIRDELSAFIHDNFGSAIEELAKRHKRKREIARAREEEEDEERGPQVSVGFYAGYPLRYYYDNPFHGRPYWSYPCRYWGRHRHGSYGEFGIHWGHSLGRRHSSRGTRCR